MQIPTAGLSEESFPGKRRTEHLRHRAWERLLHRCFLSFITKDLFNTLVQNSYIIVSFQNISRLWESLISQKKRKMNCRLCSLPSRHIQIWKSWREASNQGAINVLNSWMELFHSNSEKSSIVFIVWHELDVKLSEKSLRVIVISSYSFFFLKLLFIPF